MVELSLALLGSFSAVYDQRPLNQFRTRSVQGLLAYLACQPHQVHRREALMALFWPDVLLKSAQANLRHTLHHLRQAIPMVSSAAGEAVSFVLADRRTIQLNPDGRWQVDLYQFETLTEPAAAAADSLPSETIVDARERGKGLDPWAVAREILEAGQMNLEHD